MIRKKICLLGASAVGKTSLAQRFVKSIYSDKYHTTLGAKIDKKSIEIDGKEVTLLIWDLQGEDDEFKIRPSFLRGASGFLLVIDLTRHETLVTAFSIQKMIQESLGNLPFYVLFNKNDLTEQIEITEAQIEEMKQHNWETVRTSAKSGENVERAFRLLAVDMLATDFSPEE
jgi:small GTP-binding protein